MKAQPVISSYTIVPPSGIEGENYRGQERTQGFCSLLIYSAVLILLCVHNLSALLQF